MEQERLTDEQLSDFSSRACVQLCPELTKSLIQIVREFIAIREINEKYNAEIERLKNAYREGLEQGKFDSQQEIERLTEENDNLTSSLASERVVNRQAKELLDNFHECDKLLRKENAKLQAQVERLKIDRENEKNWGKIQTKQAVKDTAKEIWNDITSYYFSLRVLGNATVELDKLAEFWHKRGVEVE